MKFDERNPFFFNPPFFVSMATAAKFVQPIPIFGLSRSIRCGCCSYQVSSISVRRVTCYDHFVFFNILAFWPFPWQRQPFWKYQPFYAQLHMAYDILTRFHKVWSRPLREIERTKMCGRIRIRIIVKKKRRIAIHHSTAVGVM